MGILDKLKGNKAARDKAKQASDAAEKKMNERTGGKYEQQIDTGQQQAERRLGMDRDRPDQP
ncbi:MULTISPECIES: antitoxin [Streptomyces]|uniref:Antitoxin n=1 Tax=Streptomyces edwardsiae TaxID=3075527 RepID=A0ABU2QFA0_9ACTN|nr:MULTISPECIES: antitoxin [unclassified Streptomyces]MDT0395279.1 antitoxin [Streptomyces sp. DSM 41636]MDT0403133.1 antitoxin [Streptomyces sp. DSM 41635]